MRLAIFVGTVIAATAMTCTTSPVNAADKPGAALKVWQHHLEGAKNHDLDLFMVDFADDATVILDNGVYVGKDAIRAVAVKYLAAIPKNVADIITIGHPESSEHGVVWPFELNGMRAVDTVYVDRGKIEFLSEISAPIPANLLPAN